MARYAVHSISWGHAPLKSLLEDAKTAGYTGVELFQHPRELGGAKPVLEEFLRFGLTLIGVTAGAFEERCEFVKEYAALLGVDVGDRKVPYIYVDEWRDEDLRFRDALNAGFRLAIHPHMYKPVQTLREAAALLDRYAALRFLPDTAHLTIAGDNPVEAVDAFSQRIDAIHLKDWREDVGRSYQFYGRGFCELGDGDVDLEEVLGMLLRRNFNGWLVVEQDSTQDPFSSAKRSIDWLLRRLSGSPIRR
jgi:sugar phosphate isomerase/epimerase